MSSRAANDDDNAVVEPPKPWIERYWYVVVLVVLAVMVAGALGWYIIQRAIAKTQSVMLVNVTPAMLPQAVAGTTYSYFDLPPGVRNWDPTRVGAGTAAGAATTLATQPGGGVVAGYGTGTQYGARYGTGYMQQPPVAVANVNAPPAAYAQPMTYTRPTTYAPQTTFTLPTTTTTTTMAPQTALDSFIARNVTQPLQIKPTQQRTLRQGFQSGFDSLLSDV